jgi:glutaredoxin
MIKIYSSPTCVECIQAKTIMDSKFIKYEELQADDNMWLLRSKWVMKLPYIVDEQEKQITITDLFLM